MNEKYIVANLNMFTKNNQVFIVAENEDTTQVAGQCTIEELPTLITELAYKENIYKVKLAGSGKYAQLIEFGINMAEIQKYNEKKIEIEVI